VTTDPAAPATKEDIRLLTEQMGRYYDGTEGRLADLEEKMEAWKTELKDHFDLVTENIKHDFQGAFHDKLEQHEDRLVRLEREAGLSA
jgi:hypothetical protein